MGRGNLMAAIYIVLSILMVALIIHRARADDLDDAYNACLPHKEPTNPMDPASMRAPPFKAPWDHCLIIYREWNTRDSSEREADEARNPALKLSRDMAKKLTTPVPLPEGHK